MKTIPRKELIKKLRKMGFQGPEKVNQIKLSGGKITCQPQ